LTCGAIFDDRANITIAESDLVITENILRSSKATANLVSACHFRSEPDSEKNLDLMPEFRYIHKYNLHIRDTHFLIFEKISVDVVGIKL